MSNQQPAVPGSHARQARKVGRLERGASTNAVASHQCEAATKAENEEAQVQETHEADEEHQEEA